MTKLNENSILEANANVTILKQVIKNRETNYKLVGTFKALWIENKGVNANITSRNRQDIDKITCYIFKVLENIDSEDIIIRNDDKKAIEELKSLKEYQDKYKAHTVTTSDIYDFGNIDMWYTRIGAK